MPRGYEATTNGETMTVYRRWMVDGQGSTTGRATALYTEENREAADGRRLSAAQR
jgi:hypothetical protein